MNQRSQMLDAANEIDMLLKKKLKAKGSNLRARLKHARKKLPGKIRRQADLVATAAERLANGNQPGLANPGKVLSAHKNVVAHLGSIDLADIKEKRKVARRKWMSDFVINYAIFLALLIAAYIWFRPQ